MSKNITLNSDEEDAQSVVDDKIWTKPRVSLCPHLLRLSNQLSFSSFSQYWHKTEDGTKPKHNWKVEPRMVMTTHHLEALIAPDCVWYSNADRYSDEHWTSCWCVRQWAATILLVALARLSEWLMDWSFYWPRTPACMLEILILSALLSQNPAINPNMDKLSHNSNHVMMQTSI